MSNCIEKCAYIFMQFPAGKIFNITVTIFTIQCGQRSLGGSGGMLRREFCEISMPLGAF